MFALARNALIQKDLLRDNAAACRIPSALGVSFLGHQAHRNIKDLSIRG
jgi:hypothetical protein